MPRPKHPRVRDRAASDAPALTLSASTLPSATCQWPRDKPESWPDQVDNVPQCSAPAHYRGRRRSWSTELTINVCDAHNRRAHTIILDWLSEPLKATGGAHGSA